MFPLTSFQETSKFLVKQNLFLSKLVIKCIITIYFVADPGSPQVQLIWEEFLVGDRGCEVEAQMEKLRVFCGNAVLVKKKHKNDCILKELKVKYFQPGGGEGT